MLVGGAVMALGSFFPWERATGRVGTITYASADVKGTSEGAGPVLIAFGLIIALLAVLLLLGNIGWKAGIAALVLAGVGLVFAIGNYSSIKDDIDKGSTTRTTAVEGSVGIGLYLAMLACVLVVVVTIMFLRATRAPRSS